MTSNRLRAIQLAMACIIIGTLHSENVRGAAIADRTALQSILGGPGTLEDFESFMIGAGLQAPGLTITLDSSTVTTASGTGFGAPQGPGLVVPGVTFMANGSGLIAWNGVGRSGAPSKEIFSGNGLNPAQPLEIDFASSVDAFGIDLRAFSGFSATATVEVFASDDSTLVGTISSIALGSNGIPVFAGFEDTAGIGRIRLTQMGQPWSPVIDNLEFGNAPSVSIPEPSSLAALGLGACLTGARRRRRRPEN